MLLLLYNFFDGGERRMEKMLETILEEIRGVKEEVQEIRVEVKETKQELRNEMQEMKQELRSEMQEMKQELRVEMEERFAQQSKEIGEELSNVVIFLEKRDNELKEMITESKKVQNEILKELEKNRAEHKVFEARLNQIEITQAYMEEKLLKSS